jgi:hypothetical protein
MNPASIHVHRLRELERGNVPRVMFGPRFLWVRSCSEEIAASLSADYVPCTWRYYVVRDASGEGFCMAPFAQSSYEVGLASGAQFHLSAFSFGLACCLASYALLSHSPESDFVRLCQVSGELLRRLAAVHPESDLILQAAFS